MLQEKYIDWKKKKKHNNSEWKKSCTIYLMGTKTPGLENQQPSQPSRCQGPAAEAMRVAMSILGRDAHLEKGPHWEVAPTALVAQPPWHEAAAGLSGSPGRDQERSRGRAKGYGQY